MGWALQLAKRNIVKYYAVVGITDELQNFCRILENAIPHFFEGMEQQYVEYMETKAKCQYTSPTEFFQYFIKLNSTLQPFVTLIFYFI